MIKVQISADANSPEELREAASKFETLANHMEDAIRSEDEIDMELDEKRKPCMRQIDGEFCPDEATEAINSGEYCGVCARLVREAAREAKKPEADPVKKTEADPAPKPETEPTKPATEPAAKPESTVGVDLDSEDQPWDSRIHSDGKNGRSKIEKAGSNGPAGSWKKIRGVSKETVAKVQAEHTATMAAGGMVPAQALETVVEAYVETTAPPVERILTPEDLIPTAKAAVPLEKYLTLEPTPYTIKQLIDLGFATVKPVDIAPPPAAIDPPPADIAPPPATSGPVGMEFPRFIARVTELKTAGKLTDDVVADICRVHGAVDADGNGVVLILNSRTDLIPTIQAAIEVHAASIGNNDRSHGVA